MNQEIYKLTRTKTSCLVLGYFAVLVLIYTCLMPNPPDTSMISFGDKIVHLLSYALLFLWFAQIYHRRSQLRVVIALVSLGILIEFAQGLTDYRAFEYADMLANTLGVLVGWIIAASFVGSIIQELEKKLLTE